MVEKYLENLPEKPGIYIFKDQNGKIIYLGKAVNLKKRVGSYFSSFSKLNYELPQAKPGVFALDNELPRSKLHGFRRGKNELPRAKPVVSSASPSASSFSALHPQAKPGVFALENKTRALVSSVRKIDHIPTESEVEALILEANLIKKYQPKFNVNLKDDKNYPLIKIAVRDKYPSVLFVRKTENDGSLYFGPYPNIKALKQVLRTVRKIFPFVSLKNHPKKICLSSHLGLCPCPVIFDSPKLQRKYRKNIRHLIMFLEGKKSLVLKRLISEMKKGAEKENFETADYFKKQIEKIKSLNTAWNESSALNLPMPINQLERVECYDISNIMGKIATGSLVVFNWGEPDKKEYRRFKIKIKNGPDDPAMIREVLERRLKHREWPKPDLIVVDGGKPQVGSLVQVLRKHLLFIPVIGLAKRQEKIIIPVIPPQNGLQFKTLSLANNSPVLMSLERMRDEAHRFAFQYHKLLRSKALFSRLKPKQGCGNLKIGL